MIYIYPLRKCLLLLYFFTMPYGIVPLNNYIGLALALILVVDIFLTKRFAFSIFSLLLSIPFLLELEKLVFWDHSYQQAYLTLRYSPMLIFSTLLIGHRDLSKRMLQNILIAFIMAVLLGELYCWGNVFVDIFNKKIPFYNFFNFSYSYHALAGYLFLQANYMSLFVCMQIILCYEYLLISEKKYMRFIILILLVISTLIVFQLAVRSMILISILISVVYMVRLVFYDKEYFKWFSFMFFFYVLFVFLLIQNVESNFFLVRFKSSLTDIRLDIWESAIQVWRDNRGGIPYEEIPRKLNVSYDIKGLSIARDGSFHTHNQYLNVLLRHGLIGLCVFVVAYIILIYYGFKKKKYTFLLVLMITLLDFLVENQLERNRGLIFYSAFTSLAFRLEGKIFD